KNRLDEFKITLGLPTDINLEADPEELSRLHDYQFSPLEFSGEEAITVALDKRLDLKTRQDRLEDAERKVEVAANALQPGLDLFVSYRRNTGGGGQVLNFSQGDDTTSAGLDLDLPLDRKSQRNSYRQSLIHRAAVRRDLEESQDRIKQDVRNAMRDLDQAQQSYEIQRMSLSLAERRVESMALLQQAGRVSTRDVLESERALLEAQNALSRALVDFYHARLDLLLAMETLRIDDQGLWGEEYEYQQQSQ
ncbi:MAG TPA: TolC family protein, partial [Firmicutes bacterium]|nr:TolC family protein [Bacillota bacterium]